jgi:hypothetical protein
MVAIGYMLVVTIVLLMSAKNNDWYHKRPLFFIEAFFLLF